MVNQILVIFHVVFYIFWIKMEDFLFAYRQTQWSCGFVLLSTSFSVHAQSELETGLFSVVFTCWHWYTASPFALSDHSLTLPLHFVTIPLDTALCLHSLTHYLPFYIMWPLTNTISPSTLCYHSLSHCLSVYIIWLLPVTLPLHLHCVTAPWHTASYSTLCHNSLSHCFSVYII